MHVPPGRALSQNDWPGTSQKLIPSPQNPRLGVMGQRGPPGFPYPMSLPNKVSRLSAHESPQTIHFRVLDKSHSWAREGVPLPATVWNRGWCLWAEGGPVAQVHGAPSGPGPITSSFTDSARKEKNESNGGPGPKAEGWTL